MLDTIRSSGKEKEVVLVVFGCNEITRNSQE
jgi:hypothetical protein